MDLRDQSIEQKLDSHIRHEEVLLRSILERLEGMNEKLTNIRETLASHGERSMNQHDRIKRSESIILYGGGIFITIFSGLMVAILTGAL